MKYPAKLLFSFCFIAFISSINAQDADSLAYKAFLLRAKSSYSEKEYEKTRDFSLQALEANPNCGEAYIYIGLAYAAVDKECFESLAMRQFVYCLAVDKFEMAKKVDKSLSAEVDKLIYMYSSRFPYYEDTFIDFSGDSLTIGCWINEKTKIRYRE